MFADFKRLAVTNDGQAPMRFQGKITDWKDDRGFGFVTPDGGGPEVFVHIKSFSNRQRRPMGNELVTYELRTDAQGRPQGVKVAYVGDRPSGRQAKRPGPGGGALTFASVFLAFIAAAVEMDRLPWLALMVYGVGSCVTYVAYAIDKAAALRGRWRTSESTLHLLSLVGGWPGAMFAQRTLRHKTQKRSFQVMFWMTVLLNSAALAWLLTADGRRTIESFVPVL